MSDLLIDSLCIPIGRTVNLTAYCLQCKKKVRVLEPITIKAKKHNRFVYIGKCAECDHKVSTIMQEPVETKLPSETKE